jgi:hypothetical protein
MKYGFSTRSYAIVPKRSDQRSLYINNEIGTLFRDPEIAATASANFHERIGEAAF